MEASNIATSKIGLHMLLTPNGSLTHRNCKDLEVAFKTCFDKGNSKIILDFKSVAYLDSETLEILTQMHADLKSKDSVLKIINANNVCKDILLITRLINIFQIHLDLQGALKSR